MARRSIWTRSWQWRRHCPPEYREAGLANLYGQLVDEVANSRLAAEAGRADGLDTDGNVASAMKRAADRVLAEAYITDKVSSQIGEEAIQSAYDTFVADSASREQVTASHILVETEDEARAIIGQLNDGADFAELAREEVDRAQRAEWWFSWRFRAWTDGAGIRGCRLFDAGRQLFGRPCADTVRLACDPGK